jgi:hypothetical protein
VQERTQALRGGRVEGRPDRRRARRASGQGDQTRAIEGRDGVADALLAASQAARDPAGACATAARQDDLAAAQGEGVRRPQPPDQRVAFVVRERTHKEWCFHATKRTTTITYSANALAPDPHPPPRQPGLRRAGRPSARGRARARGRRGHRGPGGRHRHHARRAAESCGGSSSGRDGLRGESAPPRKVKTAHGVVGATIGVPSITSICTHHTSGTYYERASRCADNCSRPVAAYTPPPGPRCSLPARRLRIRARAASSPSATTTARPPPCGTRGQAADRRTNGGDEGAVAPRFWPRFIRPTAARRREPRAARPHPGDRRPGSRRRGS